MPILYVATYFGTNDTCCCQFSLCKSKFGVWGVSWKSDGTLKASCTYLGSTYYCDLFMSVLRLIMCWSLFFRYAFEIWYVDKRLYFDLHSCLVRWFMILSWNLEFLLLQIYFTIIIYFSCIACYLFHDILVGDHLNIINFHMYLLCINGCLPFLDAKRVIDCASCLMCDRFTMYVA